MLLGLVFVYSIKVSRSLFFNNYAQRFAATRGAGDSPQMLIKSTKVPVTTNVSLEHETPPFG
jgi:hypothetical protein